MKAFVEICQLAAMNCNTK